MPNRPSQPASTDDLKRARDAADEARVSARVWKAVGARLRHAEALLTDGSSDSDTFQSAVQEVLQDGLLNRRVLQAWATRDGVPEGNLDVLRDLIETVDEPLARRDGQIWIPLIIPKEKFGGDLSTDLVIVRRVTCVIESMDIVPSVDPTIESWKKHLERVGKAVHKQLIQNHESGFFTPDAHPEWWMHAAYRLLPQGEWSGIRRKDRSFELGAAAALLSAAFGVAIDTRVIATGLVDDSGSIQPLSASGLGPQMERKVRGLRREHPLVQRLIVADSDRHTAEAVLREIGWQVTVVPVTTLEDLRTLFPVDLSFRWVRPKTSQTTWRQPLWFLSLGLGSSKAFRETLLNDKRRARSMMHTVAGDLLASFTACMNFNFARSHNHDVLSYLPRAQTGAGTALTWLALLFPLSASCYLQYALAGVAMTLPRLSWANFKGDFTNEGGRLAERLLSSRWDRRGLPTTDLLFAKNDRRVLRDTYLLTSVFVAHFLYSYACELDPTLPRSFTALPGLIAVLAGWLAYLLTDRPIAVFSNLTHLGSAFSVRRSPPAPAQRPLFTVDFAEQIFISVLRFWTIFELIHLCSSSSTSALHASFLSGVFAVAARITLSNRTDDRMYYLWWLRRLTLLLAIVYVASRTLWSGSAFFLRVQRLERSDAWVYEHAAIMSLYAAVMILLALYRWFSVYADRYSDIPHLPTDK